MSKYTTEVRYICESALENIETHGADSVDDILTKSAPLVFNFDFPIFDEQYRLTLERKILKHYYMREIGAETVGLWKLWLNTRLNEIMPYYNKLYESELLKFNPFYDTDYKRDGSAEQNETGNKLTNAVDTIKSEADSIKDRAQKEHADEHTNEWNLYSDTPQGDVRDMFTDYKGDDYDHRKTYLTNARNIKSDTQKDATLNRKDYIGYEQNDKKESENNEQTNIKNINDYIECVVGKRGTDSYSKLLTEFRTTFLNIDMMIIEELKDLFMGLW